MLHTIGANLGKEVRRWKNLLLIKEVPFDLIHLFTEPTSWFEGDWCIFPSRVVLDNARTVLCVWREGF